MPNAISGYTKTEILVAAIFPMGLGSTDLSGDLLTQLSYHFDQGLLKVSAACDWRFLHTEATMTWGSASSSYDFKSNSILVDQIEEIRITTTGYGRRVKRDSLARFKEEDPEGTLTGTPCRYAEWGDGIIVFDRTTDQSYTAKLLYKQTPPMVTNLTDYPIISREYQNNLVNYVRWKYASDKGDSRTSTYQNDYTGQLEADVFREQNILDSGNQRIAQPNEAGYGASVPSMQDALIRQWG